MPMTYNDIWKTLTPEDRLRAGEAFWTDKSGPQQQGALQLLATRYKFRPKSLKALPPQRKARMLIELPLPADITMLLLAAFHLTHRKSMLTDFLDALGIPHKEGFLDETGEIAAPNADAVGKAVELLKGKYPANEVEIYLETLHMQDPEFWKELAPYLAAAPAQR